jgi:hypothetical protein
VIARRPFQLIKIAGDQADPAASELPTNLNLLMIEGISRDKIDRLAELGIGSAQYLACQNPFILWPRLPYGLYLLVDWIGQAQLYRLAKEVRLRKMREISMNNIFDRIMLWPVAVEDGHGDLPRAVRLASQNIDELALLGWVRACNGERSYLIGQVTLDTVFHQFIAVCAAAGFVHPRLVDFFKCPFATSHG